MGAETHIHGPETKWKKTGVTNVDHSFKKMYDERQEIVQEGKGMRDLEGS